MTGQDVIPQMVLDRRDTSKVGRPVSIPVAWAWQHGHQSKTAYIIGSWSLSRRVTSPCPSPHQRQRTPWRGSSCWEIEAAFPHECIVDNTIQYAVREPPSPQFGDVIMADVESSAPAESQAKTVLYCGGMLQKKSQANSCSNVAAPPSRS